MEDMLEDSSVEVATLTSAPWILAGEYQTQHAIVVDTSSLALIVGHSIVYIGIADGHPGLRFLADVYNSWG
jgi:hypothetical protein